MKPAKAILSLVIAFVVQLANAEEPVLNLGIPMSSYAHDNESDAAIAADVFLKQAIQGSGLNLSTKVYDRDEELGRDIGAGRSDVFIVNSGLYLDCEKLFSLQPILIGTRTERPTETLVLVASKDNTLSSLKDGSLVIDNSSRGETPERWISDHLLRSGAGDIAQDYFSNVTNVNSASRAVIPVYFGKVDAAIVSEAGFERMRAHNPDVFKRLQVVSKSKPLARTVVCMRSDYDSYRTNDIVNTLKGLTQSESGRNFLDRIGTSKFFPFKAQDLLFNREMQNRLETALTRKGGDD